MVITIERFGMYSVSANMFFLKRHLFVSKNNNATEVVKSILRSGVASTRFCCTTSQHRQIMRNATS